MIKPTGMHRMLVKAALVCALLAGCSTQSPPPVQQRPDLPAMKRFTGRPPAVSPRSNEEIAADFLDLAFEMENGLKLTKMTRFEGPVTVRVLGRQPNGMQADLSALLTRLRSEARIDIRQVSAQQSANITVEVVTRSQIRRAVPGAACLVIPNVDSYADFQKNRRASQRAWSTLQVRTKMAIFLPGDESPQEVRDCLHEEIAQALGPLNDLYRLQDSVFNDDNMHTVLTSFDMLILRSYYDPALRNGISRAEAAARLPAILARLNPGGNGYRGTILDKSPRAWINQTEIALAAGSDSGRGLRAARNALLIAQDQNWKDGRLAFSLFVEGRALIGRDNDLAVQRLLQAEERYRALGRADLQAAHVSLHLAAFALSVGQPAAAIDRINPYLRVVERGQNAALYAKMLMIKAEALERLGRDAQARSVRLDSLGWARYGFGSERNIRAELREVAAIGKRGSS